MNFDKIKSPDIKEATKTCYEKMMTWQNGALILIDNEIEPIIRMLDKEKDDFKNKRFRFAIIDSSTDCKAILEFEKNNAVYAVYNQYLTQQQFIDLNNVEHLFVNEQIEWGGEIKDFQMNDEEMYPITAGVANLHAHIDGGYAASDEIKIDLTKTIATVDCDVYITTRATHMSRVAQTIEKGGSSIESVVKNVKRALGNQSKIDMKFSFTALATNQAPISNKQTSHPIDVIIAYKEIEKEEAITEITLQVYGTSCCPCSRNMSLLINNLTWQEKFELFSNVTDSKLLQKLANCGFGAHNQRSKLTATISMKAGLWINVAEIYEVMVKAFSAPIVNLLKRPDEKYQTELMYGGRVILPSLSLSEQIETYGAKFSEDIVRSALEYLEGYVKDKKDYTIYSINAVCENEESIHTSTAISKARKEFK